MSEDGGQNGMNEGGRLGNKCPSVPMPGALRELDRPILGGHNIPEGVGGQINDSRWNPRNNCPPNFEGSPGNQIHGQLGDLMTNTGRVQGMPGPTSMGKPTDRTPMERDILQDSTPRILRRRGTTTKKNQ